jgi:hypothetical protein
MYLPQNNTRFLAPVLVVAMLQGLLLWWVSSTNDAGTWPGNDLAWQATLLQFGIVFAPLMYGLAPWSQRRIAWVFAAAIAVLLLASDWQLAGHHWVPGDMPWRRGPPSPQRVVIQVLLLFHAVPFLQGFLRTGRWRPEYPALFLDAWQNALRIALAAAFTGVFWLLLWLCAQLFDMIGLPFIRVLLAEVPGYSFLLVCPAFAVGFGLVGSAERLLGALRQQVLTLLKWLLPIATLVLVAFSIALLVRTPALWAEKQHVIRAVWLLWLAIVTVYLYNAAFQDGSIETPYSPVLGRLLAWSAPLLVLLSAMAAYDLWIRIDAYGLTEARYWAVVVVLITLAYSLGYAWAGIRAGLWMAGMGRTNVCVALVLIALLSASMIPLTSPARLAARSQAQKLAASDGTAGPDDFMRLRFDMGRDGYDELQRLAADAHTSPGIRTGARRAVAVSSWQDRYLFKYTTVPMTGTTFVGFPAGSVVDADLGPMIYDLLPTVTRAERKSAGNDDICTDTLSCPVLFIDLDGDGKPEAIAFLPFEAEIFQRGVFGWSNIGQMDWRHRTQASHQRSGADLLQLLRSGEYRTVEPHWKSLEFGQDRLNLGLPESGQPPKRQRTPFHDVSY